MMRRLPALHCYAWGVLWIAALSRRSRRREHILMQAATR